MPKKTEGETSDSKNELDWPQVNVRMPPVLKGHVQRAAKNEGLSVQHYIIRCLEDKLGIPQSELRSKGRQAGFSPKKSDKLEDPQ